jgi:hypothetical protein
MEEDTDFASEKQILLEQYRQLPGWPATATLKLARRQKRRDISKRQKYYERCLAESRQSNGGAL